MVVWDVGLWIVDGVSGVNRIMGQPLLLLLVLCFGCGNARIYHLRVYILINLKLIKAINRPLIVTFDQNYAN